MEEYINIPYEKLAQDCGIMHTDNSRKTIEAVSALADSYSGESLARIYNYFFEHSCCWELLKFLLDKIDKLKSASSLPVLIDALLMRGKMAEKLKDSAKTAWLRTRIIKVLADTKDSQAVYPLLYCLNDKNENYKIKLSCADALGRIGGSYAVMPLIKVVEDEEEESIYVKESAVSALGMLGDSKAVDSLVSILETKKGFIDKFTFLKERALEALNKLKFKGNRVIKALEKSLHDESPQIRINAIEVLMNSNDEHAPELIRNMLFDKNLEVVKNAAAALYNLFDADILDEIINDEAMPETAKNAALNIKDDIMSNNEENNED